MKQLMDFLRTGSFGSVYKGSFLNFETPIVVKSQPHTKGSIALDVGHALDYLRHDEDQVVVHCDVKPNNFLLDEDIVAYFRDFGLARLIRGTTEDSSKDQVSSSTIEGTIGCLPLGVRSRADGPVLSQGDILEVVDQCLLEPFAEDRTGTVENKIKCMVMFAKIGVACS
ncbi:hypothetical protein KIW84_021119 [Lathyrus oleraceus]|uniref:Protein kinase domain-containing protein n=1 Tax=Pisum sativum TaxID=3888 RepID=A0A9D4YCL1_PEA|nr:hypothetical protein KIW84_021119 [Pisum sativum]